MAKITAYLDNCIACGIIFGDLEAAQMAATRWIEQNARNEIQVVTSRESWREQDRTQASGKKSKLEQSRGNVPVVQDDHRLLGFHTNTDQFGGFTCCPMITEVVDEELFASFRQAGLKDADARHLMYAVQNKCDRFVTTDPHFTDRRPSLEKLCRGLLIVTPVELMTELRSTILSEPIQ
jgi:hypothetical protein